MLALCKYVHYHTTASSDMLPLDNRGTSFLFYYNLFCFLTYNLDLLIECSLLAE